MSGFWGIFRPDGGPVDMEAFNQMCKASERESFDGMETHVEDGIAMGHLMLRVSPESKYDKQPLKSDCGNYLLVGHFRLDYRDELGDKLGLTQSELEKTPDSRLAMMAYIKWKENCVHHLEGDWAFCVFNSCEKDFVLLKDKGGISALYYTIKEKTLYFSDSINHLSFLSTDLNFEELINIYIDRAGISNEKTLLHGILHVANGGQVIYSKYGVKKISYFKLENFKNKNIFYSKELDYCLDYLFIFSNAVRSRIISKKKIGIFLSSGADSIAVASIIDYNSEKSANEIFSYTSYPLYQDNINIKNEHILDESIKVKDFLNSDHQSIKGKFHNFPDFNILNHFDRRNKADHYYPIITSNTFWIRGFINLAKNDELDILFTGQMGNYVLSYAAPLIHLNLFFTFSFSTLFREIKNISKNDNVSIFTTIFRRIVNPLSSQFFWAFRGYYRNFKKIFFGFLKFNLKNFDFKVLVNTFFKTPKIYFDSRKFRIDQLALYTRVANLIWYKEGYSCSFFIADPTNDFRFIDYSLSIPEILFNYSGTYKYIYKKALSSYIPTYLYKTNQKSIQSYDFLYRIQNCSNLYDLLVEFKKNNYESSIKLNYNHLIYQHSLIKKLKYPGQNQFLLNDFIENISIVHYLSANKL